MKDLRRRDVLKIMAAGATVAGVPAVFGCAGKNSGLLAAPASGSGHFERFGVGPELLRKVISRGLSRGGDFCEVFLQHKISHRVEMEDGLVSKATSNVDLGAGVRVVKGDATGYAYSEDLAEPALLKAAATAAEVADGASGTEARSLAAVTVPTIYAVDIPWSEVSISRKVPIVQRADAAARGADPHITKVGVLLLDEQSRILVADSDGRMVEDDQPMTVFKVSCTAEKDGQTEQSMRSLGTRDGIGFYTDGRVDACAREAVDYTMRLFGAKSPPAGQYPVVLAPGKTGILLHEAMGHGFEADYNRRGISIYSDKMGKRVAPAGVTIVDDGIRGRNRGSINVDDEGTRAEQTVLVEDGVLRSYMQDRISAKHYGAGLTGSGRRQSYKYPPNPRMRNTYMLDGTYNPEEIVSTVKKGLYAEYFLNGQVMIGVGDFTFYLKHGRMIEDGKLTDVVKDANLIGNGPQVLETIDMVGNDLAIYDGSSTCGKDGQWVPVGFGLPTVRCGRISIGGRK